MRNTAARAILRPNIARHELGRVQDAVLRPRFVAPAAAVASQKFCSQTCLRQLAVAPNPSLLPLAPRAFHTTTHRYKSKPQKNGKGHDKGLELLEAAADGGGGSGSEPASSSSSKHPPANPEEPLNFADVESRIEDQNAHFALIIKKLRSGGRFNPDVIGALRVQPDRKSSTTYPLKEVAQVIPRGGRTISILAHEEEYIKPIMSAVQASPDFNQQPQRVPDNDLELLLKIEPESKDEMTRRVRIMFTEWRDRIRAIRHRRDKQHIAWLRERAIGPDRKRMADKELDKVIKKKMTLVDTQEKDVMKSLEVSK